jgi:hypothetical protein
MEQNPVINVLWKLYIMLNLIRSYSTQTIEMRADSVEKDDDTDTDTDVEIQICVLGGDNLILSNVSPDNSKIKFHPGSFSFHYENSCIMIQLHPIFLWNMVQQMKNISTPDYEVDYIRIRTFVSHYMKGMISDIRIYVYEDRVSFNRNGIVISIETDQYFTKLLFAYNSLYNDIKRQYNTFEKTTEIINECSDIIQLICNPTFDKRIYKVV